MTYTWWLCFMESSPSSTADHMDSCPVWCIRSGGQLSKIDTWIWLLQVVPSYLSTSRLALGFNSHCAAFPSFIQNDGTRVSWTVKPAPGPLNPSTTSNCTLHSSQNANGPMTGRRALFPIEGPLLCHCKGRCRHKGGFDDWGSKATWLRLLVWK